MDESKHDLSSFAGRLAWVFDQEGRGSRRKAAAAGGFREQRISEWTNPDNRDPSLESLQMISTALPHVRMEWLINNTGEPYREERIVRRAVADVRRLLDEVEQHLNGSPTPPHEGWEGVPPVEDVVGKSRPGGKGDRRETGSP